MDQKNRHVIPFRVNVQCLRNPNFQVAVLEAQTEDDYSNRIILNGSNFDSSLEVLCHIEDHELFVSGIVSRNELLFHIPVLLPGYRKVSFMIDRKVYLTYESVCFNTEFIRRGGKLISVDESDCVESESNILQQENIIEQSTKVYKIREASPRSGLTVGHDS